MNFFFFHDYVLTFFLFFFSLITIYLFYLIFSFLVFYSLFMYRNFHFHLDSDLVKLFFLYIFCSNFSALVSFGFSNQCWGNCKGILPFLNHFRNQAHPFSFFFLEFEFVWHTSYTNLYVHIYTVTYYLPFLTLIDASIIRKKNLITSTDNWETKQKKKKGSTELIHSVYYLFYLQFSFNPWTTVKYFHYSLPLIFFSNFNVLLFKSHRHFQQSKPWSFYTSRRRTSISGNPILENFLFYAYLKFWIFR